MRNRKSTQNRSSNRHTVGGMLPRHSPGAPSPLRYVLQVNPVTERYSIVCVCVNI